MDSVRELASSAKLFDVAIDKGTFDAVTLTPDDADPQSISVKSRDIYLLNVHRLLRPGGIVVVTSCNWTSEELSQEFSRAHMGRGQLFSFVHEVPPTTTFTFGGAMGANTVCLVFKCLK